MDLKEWLAKAPDLNPIKIVGGALARSIYCHRRQYSSVKELETAKKQNWNSISTMLIQKFVKSVPAWCTAVIKPNAGKVDY